MKWPRAAAILAAAAAIVVTRAPNGPAWTLLALGAGAALLALGLAAILVRSPWARWGTFAAGLAGLLLPVSQAPLVPLPAAVPALAVLAAFVVTATPPGDDAPALGTVSRRSTAAGWLHLGLFLSIPLLAYLLMTRFGPMRLALVSEAGLAVPLLASLAALAVAAAIRVFSTADGAEGP